MSERRRRADPVAWLVATGAAVALVALVARIDPERARPVAPRVIGALELLVVATALLWRLQDGRDLVERMLCLVVAQALTVLGQCLALHLATARHEDLASAVGPALAIGAGLLAWRATTRRERAKYAAAAACGLVHTINSVGYHHGHLVWPWWASFGG